MTKNVILKRITSAACAVILLTTSFIFSVSAEESTNEDLKASVYFWNLASTLEEYGGTYNEELVPGASGKISSPGSYGGTCSIPLDLIPELDHLYYGALYPTTLAANQYNNGATFKMVITITLGVSGSYSGDKVPLMLVSISPVLFVEPVVLPFPAMVNFPLIQVILILLFGMILLMIKF